MCWNYSKLILLQGFKLVKVIEVDGLKASRFEVQGLDFAFGKFKIILLVYGLVNDSKYCFKRLFKAVQMKIF